MEGLNNQEQVKSPEGMLDHREKEGIGERSVAEKFGPLTHKPFSEVGTKGVLEKLSYEAISSRN